MKEPWYAVRCLFSHPTRARKGETLFEERITLWKCASENEAYLKAETEAAKYATEANCIFIRATDAFHLFDELVSEGSEVWSTMRGSRFNAEQYEDTFISTSADRQHTINVQREQS
ncbi:DUF4288 domain-containing protein [Cerasicoccus fimbriatus]|uniref:DUF4288 domain-containing protein n=1 Tax=Cerasicoccus fimbriatus TaxID=3014554 RepID=UPI0022B2AD62|nr:DUF4288 domain-containing protein [Cerasicoccus sp. TK19100]